MLSRLSGDWVGPLGGVPVVERLARGLGSERVANEDRHC